MLTKLLQIDQKLTCIVFHILNQVRISKIERKISDGTEPPPPNKNGHFVWWKGGGNEILPPPLEILPPPYDLRLDEQFFAHF